MSNEHGCDTSLNRFHDQRECSHCKTLLRKMSVCCNSCVWQRVRCSEFKRSADHLPWFQCPRCTSKAAHVPTTALPLDPHTKNQDNTTPLPSREAQVDSDGANDGPIIATPHPHNVAEENDKIYEAFWHTLP